MQHLSLEELARLVDEPPSPDEAIHLGTCGDCREEMESLRSAAAELRALPGLKAPDGAWLRLEARLRAEGLSRGRAGRWTRAGGVAMRVAAALALFVAGGITGGLLRGPATPSAGPAAARAVPQNVQEAEQVLLASEAAYMDALARYGELTGSPPGGDPLNRLAALEGIVLTTRAALQDAPADPVINGYHLNALSEREAILRQISNTARDGWF